MQSLREILLTQKINTDIKNSSYKLTNQLEQQKNDEAAHENAQRHRQLSCHGSK
jgi:hypothetical protein